MNLKFYTEPGRASLYPPGAGDCWYETQRLPKSLGTV